MPDPFNGLIAQGTDSVFELVAANGKTKPAHQFTATGLTERILSSLTWMISLIDKEQRLFNSAASPTRFKDKAH